MKDVNKVILIGRLGSDPAQRQTKAGTSLASFSVATSRKITRDTPSAENSSPNEETQWHRIVAWGKVGEACAQYLKKGSPVYIEGSLRSRQFEGKDGRQQTLMEVHTDTISFLGTNGRKSSPDSNEHHMSHSGHHQSLQEVDERVDLPSGAL